MIVVVYDPATGEILRTVTAPDDLIADNVQAGEAYLETSEFVTGDTHYVDSWGLVEKPPRPSGFHQWDSVTRQWAADLPAAKAFVQQLVDRQRARRIAFPLAYDGKSLDADESARTNLSNKITEMAQRASLSLPTPAELLVWRDADNNTWSWATPVEYANWLGGFAVAMAERGTLNYMTAWQHKTNLDALTTVEDVLAYDFSGGWV